MTVTSDMLGMTSAAFQAHAWSRGIPGDAALQVYRSTFRRGTLDPVWTRGAARVRQSVPEGETVKFVQQLDDGLETESVILPQTSRTGRRRTTLCVSSQVGCAMGCVFCETAQMGLMRHLTASEIVGQWFGARFELMAPIDNIVFMGMGEPMDNLDAVLASIEVFVDANGPALAASRIAVSTVGHEAGIRRLAAFVGQNGFRQLRLAVSINAPTDEIRSAIMPLNRVTPLARLKAALETWPATPQRPLLIEYVLIPDVNDAPGHAEALCAYLGALPAHVNVIPYNPRRNSPWPAPDEASVDRFVAAVREAGRFATRRRTMGREAMAACGQLGNARIRRRRLVPLTGVEGAAASE